MTKTRKIRGRVTVEVSLRLNPRASNPEGLLIVQFGRAADEVKRGTPLSSEWDRPIVAEALSQISDALAPLVKNKKKTLRLVQRADLIHRATGGTIAAAIGAAIREAKVDKGVYTGRVRTALRRFRAARKA